MPRWIAVALLALLSLAASEARAQEDGVYGRLDGDLTLELGLGGGVTFDADAVSGAGTFEVRARYLDMAGLMIGADVRPDRPAMGGGGTRLLAMVDLRPLWLARFLLGGSLGDRWADLFIDSIGIDLGVAVTPLDAQVGAALAVGFGMDLPLVFFGDGIEGLALRLYGRHVAALATDSAGPTGGRNDWIAGGALVLRLQARTGLPAWERPRYRDR